MGKKPIVQRRNRRTVRAYQAEKHARAQADKHKIIVHIQTNFYARMCVDVRRIPWVNDMYIHVCVCVRVFFFGVIA